MSKIYSISLPDSPKNIATIRKFAKSKGLKLEKVRNLDLWNIKNTDDSATILSQVSLEDAYNFIINYEY